MGLSIDIRILACKSNNIRIAWACPSQKCNNAIFQQQCGICAAIIQIFWFEDEILNYIFIAQCLHMYLRLVFCPIFWLRPLSLQWPYVYPF